MAEMEQGTPAGEKHGLAKTALLLVVALAVGFWGVAQAYTLDWSMLSIAALCLMPALMLADILAMCLFGWLLFRQRNRAYRPSPLLLYRLAGLATLHLAVAGFAGFLLIDPMSSPWLNGISLLQFRVLFLTLAAYALLKSVQLPWFLARVLVHSLCSAPCRSGEKGGIEEQ